MWRLCIIFTFFVTFFVFRTNNVYSDHCVNLNIQDILAIAQHPADSPSDPNYNPLYDVNHDNKVNQFDVTFARECFGSGQISISVTGPNGEDKNNLPSVQSDAKIWYDITVRGLEPNTGYHIKIYRKVGNNHEQYRPGLTNGQLESNWDAAGVKDICSYVEGVNDDGSLDLYDNQSDAVSDSEGTLVGRLGDSYLPDRNALDQEDDQTPIGEFVLEVARSDTSANLGGDCQRKSEGPNNGYVAHTEITIIDTPKDYRPAENEFTSGRNPCTPEGCETAFGNIPTDITKFAGKVLSIALGIAGGIALILLVYGSIRVLTSTGNPQNVAAGRDIIVAAIAGLLFLIFSVLILRALGLIAGIPFL